VAITITILLHINYGQLWDPPVENMYGKHLNTGSPINFWIVIWSRGRMQSWSELTGWWEFGATCWAFWVWRVILLGFSLFGQLHHLDNVGLNIGCLWFIITFSVNICKMFNFEGRATQTMRSDLICAGYIEVNKYNLGPSFCGANCGADVHFQNTILYKQYYISTMWGPQDS